MAFADILNLMAGNLGVSLEAAVLLVTFLGSLLFMARDLRIGLVILLVLFSSEFIVFYITGLSTLMALTATLVTLVCLALAIYISFNKNSMAVI